MRRVLAVGAVACLLGAFPVPTAAASGAGPPPNPTCFPGVGPCTETDHFGELLTASSPFNCPGYFSGWALFDVLGNGIQHISVNGAQDAWFTTTFTGTATVSPVLVTITPNPDPTMPPTITITPDPSRPILTGHLQAWFGFQSNNHNFSQSDTANFQGSAPDGTTYSFHQNDHLNTTGNNPFVPNRIVMHAFC